MTTKTKRGQFVQAKEAATFSFRGETIVISPNTILDASHPMVRKFPQFFKELEPRRQRPLIEQATDDPGELR